MDLTITPLTLIIAVTLAFAILYPGDPAGRRQRTKRVLVASATLTVAMILSASIAYARTVSPPEGLLERILVVWTLLFPFHLAPFGLAERLAGFAEARRTLGWALAAVTVGIAWSVVLGFVLIPADNLRVTWIGLLLAIVIPGTSAGLAWYLLLVDRQEDAVAVFE